MALIRFNDFLSKFVIFQHYFVTQYGVDDCATFWSGDKGSHAQYHIIYANATPNPQHQPYHILSPNPNPNPKPNHNPKPLRNISVGSIVAEQMLDYQVDEIGHPCIDFEFRLVFLQ